MKTVWMLTEEYNDYDQYGEYFLDVFETKPSREQLAEVINILPNSEEMTRLLEGGGRSYRYEHQWYFLREIPLKKGGRSVDSV